MDCGSPVPNNQPQQISLHGLTLIGHLLCFQIKEPGRWASCGAVRLGKVVIPINYMQNSFKPKIIDWRETAASADLGVS